VDDVSSLPSDRAARGRVNAEQARELILGVVAAIPRGSVLSYGGVAAQAGLPGRARLVARLLSQLPHGNALPWHRVLRASGGIAFAPGSADFDRQRRLLEAEGCVVSASGKVKATNRQPQSLDEALWGGLFPN
jgi:methylated-DNA-protein-cysteine methyltransferase-like protein